MTYIAPNSTLKLLHNVPLDVRYINTIYFRPDNTGLQAQYEYFSGLTKYTLTNQSYQRANKGSIRVEKKTEDLYDCNYIMFQNTSFGNKWFYAFITKIDYINNAVSEISYVIDVMQTWNSEYVLNECYVEREHVVNDNFFTNYLPESIDMGDTYVTSQQVDWNFTNTALFACYADDSYDGNVFFDIYYSGMRYLFLGIVNDVTVTNIHNRLSNLPADSIISLYEYPTDLLTITSEGGTPPQYTVANKSSNLYIDLSNLINYGTSPILNGYRIKNRKLMSAPFTQIRITNNVGDYKSFGLQYFDYTGNHADKAIFTLVGTFVPEPQIVIIPDYYKGCIYNTDESLFFNNYIMTPYSIDTYKQWWYNNKYQSTGQAIIGALRDEQGSKIDFGSIGHLPNEGFMNLILPGSGSLLSDLGEHSALSMTGTMAESIAVYHNMRTIQNLKYAPDTGKQGSQNNLVLSQLDKYGYTVDILSLPYKQLEKIDEYFDRYGYSVQLTKIPNRNARPHWTYTKTIGCTIRGSIPQDDMRTICSIYDNGITFWINGNEVGNYSLDNSVPQYA